jgi:hypothetical protein
LFNQLRDSNGNVNTEYFLLKFIDMMKLRRTIKPAYPDEFTTNKRKENQKTDFSLTDFPIHPPTVSSSSSSSASSSKTQTQGVSEPFF